MKNISVLAIDLAKSSFHVHGNNASGKCLIQRAMNRRQLEAFVQTIPACTIAMEACGSAHFWARHFSSLGHAARLIAPQFVRPFVTGNKNDRTDAQAIAEAVVRPSMRFTSVKSREQLDLQAIHRVRERLVRQRTALTNEIRGILFENGIVVPQGSAALKKTLQSIIGNEYQREVSATCRVTCADLVSELSDLEERISNIEKRLAQIGNSNPTCKLLQSIPGVGLITSTALIATVADPGQFKNGRHFAAWLGLVPKHSGTGGASRNKLGKISKRGDPYLRRLLVQGSRSALRVIEQRKDPGAEWCKKLKTTKGWNKAAVALANKNARIIWALMVSNTSFNVNLMAKAS